MSVPGEKTSEMSCVMCEGGSCGRSAQLCQEIEKKAVLVREQQAEFQRVQLAYAQARCCTA